jgi:hypothetical protein
MPSASSPSFAFSAILRVHGEGLAFDEIGGSWDCCFSKRLAGFGRAAYTFVLRGVISSSRSFFKGKTDGFETD